MRTDRTGSMSFEGTGTTHVTHHISHERTGRTVQFANRADAGRHLAVLLVSRGFDRDAVVVGLPRGGVPVADRVAEALDAVLDVVLVRKLGVPNQPELAAGAIGEQGIRIINDHVATLAGLTSDDLDRIEARERQELEQRATRFRAVRPRVDLRGRTVIVVDDGIATGATARAACQVAREQGAARVVLAVPVAPAGWESDFIGAADEVMAVETPERFVAVGQWYGDFSAVSDADVITCLQAAAERDRLRQTRAVTIPSGPSTLAGILTVPPDARAAVVFAHGSGSGRHSHRNQFVAERLNDAGLATLLFDFFATEEEHERPTPFDVDATTRRLLGVTWWLRSEAPTCSRTLGYFGASTGAAAALIAATHPDSGIAAVVSRGGRPELAGERLRAVRTPTLLIVGSRDSSVLEANRTAYEALDCTKRLEIVEGATHLFEEPGTLDIAADLACAWFLEHFSPVDR